jgi:hypothetical protein
MNRTDILSGDITLPQQIIELVGTQYSEEMNSMFDAIVHAFIKNEGSVSAPYWSDRFNNKKVFNTFLLHLSKAGWITTTVEPHRNWAEISFNSNKLLKWVSKEEITTMREIIKLKKYLLEHVSYGNTSKTTKTPKGVKVVGHTRKGINKHTNSHLQFDTVMMYKYQDAITLNTTKGIRTLKLDHSLFTDKAHYEAIASACIQYYIEHPYATYTLGTAISDSRGRAIYSCTSKVFNPIGFKDARALMVTAPTVLTERAIERIQLAVAELLGDKSTTVLAKRAVGFKAINNSTLLDLDLDTEEGRKDLHNNIWLERIYANWKEYPVTKQWIVPIELDQSASMLQIEGVLLNSTELCNITNLVGNTLSDPWKVEGLAREQVKKVMTPTLYGSSASAIELWDNANIEFNMNDVKLINHELIHGPYAIANALKDYIINNVKPAAEMEVTVWNETFTVYCNKYKYKGDITSRYDVYNSKKGIVESIYHTSVHQVPDLEAFKRYFMTLLVHGIDSQIENDIASALDWCIPIFDATVVNPVEAEVVENVFLSNMIRLNQDRNTILSNYFKSIGITSQSATQWKHVTSLVTPLKEFTPSAMSLK